MNKKTWGADGPCAQNHARHLFISAFILLTACTDGGPRELPSPTLDPRAPFEELAPTQSGGKAGAAKAAGKSDFERAIAASMGQPDDPPPGTADDPDDPPGVQTQRVPLPGGLASTLPLDFDAWQFVTAKGVTIVTWRPPGQSVPDAVIYAEPLGGIMAASPSEATRLFALRADPTLATLLAVLEAEAAEDPDQRKLPTLNLGFRSSADSFSGWRWFGQNAAGTNLRLGRTRGMWQRTENIGDPDPDPSDLRASGAWMLLGSASARGDMGTHLAIVCAAAPNCAVAQELSDFLANIK